MAPSSDLVERFRGDLAALVAPVPERLGVAVSGGPDSLALLLLTQAAWPERVRAATVDHRLRAESAGEATFVARTCAERGIPHAILSDGAPIAGNVQSGARALRYRLLAGWAAAEGIGCLLTAHHLDDQAETLLMRLLRGSGLSGLAGIRPAATIAGLRVLRPLLGWRRAELGQIVADEAIEPVRDPSNVDERFDRAHIRRLLAETPWLEPMPLARSALTLAQAEEALDWAAERLWRERVRHDRHGFSLDAADLPAELRRRLVLGILADLGLGPPPRGEELARLLATLESGGTATLAEVRCRGGARWTFTPAPPRRSIEHAKR